MNRIGALKRYGVDPLQRPQTLFLLLALACFASHESPAQVPDLAFRYFQAGQKRMQKGDWLSAAEIHEGDCNGRAVGQGDIAEKGRCIRRAKV